MMETIYGIISDIHDSPSNLVPAIDAIKAAGATRLILNGDLFERQETLKRTHMRFAYILDQAGRSGLETYVNKGSHEAMIDFEPVVDAFEDEYDNIISVMSALTIDDPNGTVIVLPGSDTHGRHGQYVLGADESIPTGNYFHANEGLMSFDSMEEALPMLAKGAVAMSYQSMHDLKSKVRDAEKTIVVSHIPRKFETPDAVDIADFGIAKESFRIGEGYIQEGAIFPRIIAEELAGQGCPPDLRKENRGNEALRDVYEEIGITKAVNGHFHESGHRAHDLEGNHVKEGDYVGSLFYNSGCLADGLCGLLYVDDGKVSYRNIKLRG